MLFALAVNNNLNPLGQGVDHGDTNPVETTRDLVAAGSELAAGVENRQNSLKGAFAGFGVDIRRDAAAVVADGTAAVLFDRNPDLVAMPSEGFVNGVIDHLIDQVVQAPRPGGADVHPRALTDRLQALQDLDLLGAVGSLNFRGFAHGIRQGLSLSRRRLDKGKKPSRDQPLEVNLPPMQ